MQRCSRVFVVDWADMTEGERNEVCTLCERVESGRDRTCVYV